MFNTYFRIEHLLGNLTVGLPVCGGDQGLSIDLFSHKKNYH